MITMPPIKFLEACEKTASEFIARPSMWTQHVYARDIVGAPLDPDSPCARSWCGLGRLRVHMQCRLDADSMDALDKSATKLYGTCFLRVNDHEGREEVIKVLQDVARS